jgi:hypothetical protein
VANDPANPNRELALLRGDLELESTVIGRRSKPEPAALARISRVEQWQASYPSPEQGLVAQASGSHHLWLLLSRTP